MLENITGAKVDDEVDEKDSVGDAVEYDPMCTQVVVEKRYRNRKYDDVGNEQYQHEQIPVEPAHAHLPVVTCSSLLPSSPLPTNKAVVRVHQNNELESLA